MSSSSVAVVVMAGGKGERLWPLVRAHTPKVCVSVDGRATLLGTTLRRMAPLASAANMWVVTTASQAHAVRCTLAAARLRPRVVVEPQPRNTAACITLAAALVAHRHPDAVMVVVPADHWIQPEAAFRRALQAAIQVTRTSRDLAVVGFRPHRVHPGLGHVRAGAPQPSAHGCRVFSLARYVEKPSPRRAKRLTHQDGAYWSGGIFIGRATTFLDLARRWLPAHARYLVPLGALSGAVWVRRAQAAYQRLPCVSFDVGVMAHLRRGFVVEGRCAWEDLGSWDSWVRVSAPAGPVVTIGGRNVRVVNANGHLIATVGVDDVVIVRTPDATLICRTADAQTVKTLTARLARDTRLAKWL